MYKKILSKIKTIVLIEIKMIIADMIIMTKIKNIMETMNTAIIKVLIFILQWTKYLKT
jgi:hypothetical protein